MTSVNTNASALTALRTLQATQSQLETTQSRISTGYKIGEAKDNAAYWAISTTLKSDNKSLSTVKDALGLGASTVDTAYQGLTKAKDVLDEIKSKLTAATQDGVNRNTIQNEISQLQDQLKSIASSSVFSGENWLSVDSSVSTFSAMKSVVASFSRDSSGAVSIGTIKVDTSSVSLFDASTVPGAGGILNTVQSLKDSTGRDLTVGGTLATVGNTGTGGVAAANVTGAIAAGTASTSNAAGSAATSSDLANAVASKVTIINTGSAMTANLPASGTKMTLSFEVGGTAKSVSFVAGANAGATVTNLNNALNGTGVNAALSTNANAYLNLYTSATNTTLKVTDFVTYGANGLAAQPAAGSAWIPTTGWKSNSDTTYTAGTDYSTGGSSAAMTAATFSTSGSYVSGNIDTTNWSNKFASTDMITLNFSVDGKASSVTVAAGANFAGFVSNLNNNASFAAVSTASVGTASSATQLVLTSGSTGGVAGTPANSSTVAFTSVTFTDATGAVKAMGTGAAGLLTSGFQNISQAATTSTNTFSAITLDKDDSIVFDININGATSAKTAVITKDLVSKTLNTTDGKITNITDYGKVVNAALTAVGVSGVSVKADTTNNVLTFATTTAAGTAASIVVANAGGSNGGAQISVNKLDISDTGLAGLNATQIKQVLTAYISVVNTAINKVTSASAALGSVASRIDMQKSFVNTLMDTIDKGVGNLIDADMTEESTKLQALQVKQQLGTQALSIANQSAQGVLSLFRS